MHGFQYVRPSSVAEAVTALAHEDAVALAGGQTLIPTMKQRLAAPQTVVDLAGVADLAGIHVQDAGIGIGATTTHAAVASHAGLQAAIPALAKLAGNIGDPQVRHVGTIGGSVANNDPAADYPAAVLALGATITTNQRQVPADAFFDGLFTTVLEPGELILALGFPVPMRAAYAKYEQRASRYALVGAFVAETAQGVRVAITGAGADGVFRCAEIEQALAGGLDPAAVRAVKLAPDGMLSDLHASAEYRAAMVTEMAARAVETMLA